MIPVATQTEIMRRMTLAEQEHDVKILLAVESGSRAWGFESPDSDFDARFIYVNRRDWYLCIDTQSQRDVIEYPIVDEIDLNGWDIRKALRLFQKSNPTFIEWIQSPIVYIESGDFTRAVRSLLPEIYSVNAGMFHYRSMAQTNYRQSLRADRVRHKKYFYVLRALLSVRWIERYKKPAPIEFAKLLHLIEDNTALLGDISALLLRKRAASESALAPPIPSIHDFIDAEMARLEHLVVLNEDRSEAGLKLNDIFRRCVSDF